MTGRMATPSKAVPGTHPMLQSTSSRPVHDATQRSTTVILLPLPNAASRESRRSQMPLAQRASLRLPTDFPPSPAYSDAARGEGRTTSGGAQLALLTLVHRPGGSLSGRAVGKPSTPSRPVSGGRL